MFSFKITLKGDMIPEKGGFCGWHLHFSWVQIPAAPPTLIYPFLAKITLKTN
jgi:hypothetical protein